MNVKLSGQMLLVTKLNGIVGTCLYVIFLSVLFRHDRFSGEPYIFRPELIHFTDVFYDVCN